MGKLIAQWGARHISRHLTSNLDAQGQGRHYTISPRAQRDTIYIRSPAPAPQSTARAQRTDTAYVENKAREYEPETAKTLWHPKLQTSQGTKSSVHFLASGLFPLAACYPSYLRPVLVICPRSATWILSLWNRGQLSARCGWGLRLTFYLATGSGGIMVFHLWKQLERRVQTEHGERSHCKSEPDCKSTLALAA